MLAQIHYVADSLRSVFYILAYSLIVRFIIKMHVLRREVEPGSNKLPSLSTLS